MSKHLPEATIERYRQYYNNEHDFRVFMNYVHGLSRKAISYRPKSLAQRVIRTGMSGAYNLIDLLAQDPLVGYKLENGAFEFVCDLPTFVEDIVPTCEVFDLQTPYVDDNEPLMLALDKCSAIVNSMESLIKTIRAQLM